MYHRTLLGGRREDEGRRTKDDTARVHRRRVAPVLAVFALVASTARADQIDEYREGPDEGVRPSGPLPGDSRGWPDRRIGAYGLSDRVRNTPATPSTVYKIGSVSKQFIATAIMLLAQDGRLELDDPVGRFLEGTPDSWGPITIRQLLTHAQD